jgi:glycerophosphoryl diester phosphodiesterase
VEDVMKIQNIAHRGFTKSFPDNTLEAFEAAIEIPVDGVEFDVRETADNKFVIHHDPQLQGKDINKMSRDEIQGIKLEGKYKIPTLEETLDLFRNRTGLMIEVKEVRSIDSFLSLLRARANLDNVIVTSFNHEFILKLSQVAPEIRRGVLTGRQVDDPVGLIEANHADAIVVRCPFATVELIEDVHAHNLAVHVWGCNNMDDIRRTLKLNIDSVITDFPDQVARELSKRNERY